MSNGSARSRVVLVVLDGWGYRRRARGQRHRAGLHAGLAPALGFVPADPAGRQRPRRRACPKGQMGNSEVGHLNLGAGRVVPQDLVRISQSIQSGEFYQLPPLVELCTQLRADRRHPPPRRAARAGRRARAGPPPARLRGAGRAAAGAGHRHPRVSRRPRLRAHARRRGRPDAAARHAADRGASGRHRLAHRPLLRHGPRPALGPHPRWPTTRWCTGSARRWSIR